MTDRFKQRMRKIGDTTRPSSATIMDQVRGREIVLLPVEAIAPDPHQVRFLPTRMSLRPQKQAMRTHRHS